MKRIIDAMKRTVKNNPKGFQILKNKEGNPKEIFKKKSNSDSLKLSGSVCANPKFGWFCTERRYPNPPSLPGKYYLYHTSEDASDEDQESDEDQKPDEKELLYFKEGQFSTISLAYRRFNIEDWALRLEYDPEIVEVCGKILKYFKDGDEDVESFSRMVNAVMENENFSDALCEAFGKCLYISNFVIAYSITPGSPRESVHQQLSRIKKDWFLREAIEQGENSIFFRESLIKGDPEIIVRNGLIILLSYCLLQTYLKPRGLLRNRYIEDRRQDVKLQD